MPVPADHPAPSSPGGNSGGGGGSVPDHGTGGDRGRHAKLTELCYDVATVRDGASKRSVTACSSEPRVRGVLVTTGHVVDVEFTLRNVGGGGVTSQLAASQQAAGSVHFLIRYEGECVLCKLGALHTDSMGMAFL